MKRVIVSTLGLALAAWLFTQLPTPSVSAQQSLTSGRAMVGDLLLSRPPQLITGGSGAPVSGTSGTEVTHARPGSFYTNVANGVVYVNEGTAAAPYWTPVHYDQAALQAWHTDFRSFLGKAVADTAGTAIIADHSGLRVHGQGIDEIDSGLTVAGVAEVGAVGSLLTTNEAAHVAALGVGDTTLPLQPDTHCPCVLDVEFTNNTAITDRAIFLGFIGAAADALDPVVTGATTTLTLVLDDLAGMFLDSGLTDSDGIFLPHNKSNEAASIATTATGVDLSSTIPAAATYTRWRVELSAAGVITAFIDKAQVGSISAALDADEEIAPSFYVESNAAAIKQIDIKRVAFWANR